MPTRNIDDVVTRILDLFFSARSDVYARSFIKPDRSFGYTPSSGPVTRDIIYKHLTAQDVYPRPRTVGSYTTSLNNEVGYIVWDIDAHGTSTVAAHQTVEALSATLTDLHLDHYIEDSGCGFHIWCFTPLIQAETAYKAGRQIVDMTEECATEVEVYPKQTQIRDGLGNLVKVPLGIHWSNKRCLFLNIKTGLYIENQWDYLMNIKRVDPLQLQRIASQRRTLKPLPKGPDTRKADMRLQNELLPGPPCVGAMWRAQLREGQGRNQVLHQLAVNLQRAGFLDVEQAKEILTLWNQKQHDPLSEQEFNSAIEHAYCGARYSYGSGRCIIEEYCNVSQCPVCDNDNAKLWSIVNGTRGIRL